MTDEEQGLPAMQAVTLDGFNVDTSGPVWWVPTPIGLHRFDFDALPGAGPALRQAIMQFIAHRLAEVSPKRAHGDLSSMRGLLSGVVVPSSGSVDEITFQHHLEYEQGQQGITATAAAVLAMTLQAWGRTEIGGLSDGLRAKLSALDTTFVRGPSPVRTRCPIRGALTRRERDEAMARLREAFEAGGLKVASYFTAVLIMVLALRPGQVAALKVRDASIVRNTSGTPVHLRVTRLKQRRSRPGKSFRNRALSPAVAEVVGLQREAAIACAVARGIEPANAPLLPRGPKAPPDPGRPVDMPGYEGHARAPDVGQRFTRTMSSLHLRSARTGAAQRLTPIRARRTLATLHRAAGGTISEVRVLLDQTSDRAPHAYMEPAREVMGRVEVALHDDLRAIAAAFMPLGRCPPATTANDSREV